MRFSVCTGSPRLLSPLYQQKVYLGTHTSGDGCACAILMCPTPQKPISSTEETIKPMLYGFESMLVPDTLDSLCYEWLDDYNKFSFTISPQVLR